MWSSRTVMQKWLWIWCARLDTPWLPYSAIKSILKEFRDIELQISQSETIVGWVGASKITDPKALVWWAKCGGIPFELNIREKKLWFRKEIRHV